MKRDEQSNDHQSPANVIDRRAFFRNSVAMATGVTLIPGAASASIPPRKGAKAKRKQREAYSVCSFCQARCTTVAQVTDDKVTNVYGRSDNHWTGGSMCPKGKSIVELTYSPHRLLHPLLREGDTWKRISYRQALEIAAEKFIQVKKDFPEDHAHRVALFAPMFDSKEAELAAEFTMHLSGYPNIYYSGDTCVGNAGVAFHLCLGSGISETTIDEIPNAKVLVLFGANIAELYPPYARWIQLAKDKGTKIIYVDPRRTSTSVFGDLQIRPRPGTDGALLLGIINYLIRNNLYNADFVAAKVNGFELVKKSASPFTLSFAADICGVPPEDIKRVADILGNSSQTIAWAGGSLSRYTNGIQTARALVALQAITGNLGGKGKGILHVQSGKPGGDEGFSHKYTQHDLKYKLNFRKCLNRMKKGKVNLLLLNSSFRRYPDSNTVREAVKKVDFVIHRGFFMNEEARVSDLIIPATMAFESEGSMHGLNRQVVWRDPVIKPLGETVTEFKFYSDLGKKVCGDAFPDVNSNADMYNMLLKNAPTWQGLTIDRLKASESGIVWPCGSPGKNGSHGTLFPNASFQTKDGRIHLDSKALGALKWKEPKGSPRDKRKGDPEKFPLVFSQGKVVHHWQQTLTTWSTYMSQFSDGNYVNIHPKTAISLNLAEGDVARLETSIGHITVTVKITDDVLPGVVWTPSYPDPSSKIGKNQGQTVNSIIPNYWDKIAAQYNGFGCRLTRHS